MQTLSARNSVRGAAVRAAPARRVQRAQRDVVVANAALSPQLVIGGATVASLFLGRFVFHDWVKREGDRVSRVPKTDGNTFFDNLQKPASFVETTKDPASFTLIEMLGWGALGHVAGFATLAVNSLNPGA